MGGCVFVLLNGTDSYGTVALVRLEIRVSNEGDGKGRGGIIVWSVEV